MKYNFVIEFVFEVIIVVEVKLDVCLCLIVVEGVISW